MTKNNFRKLLLLIIIINNYYFILIIIILWYIIVIIIILWYIIVIIIIIIILLLLLLSSSSSSGKFDPTRPKNSRKFKANFRCALRSLSDVIEVKERSRKTGKDACKVFKFLEEKRRRSVG